MLNHTSEDFGHYSGGRRNMQEKGSLHKERAQVTFATIQDSDAYSTESDTVLKSTVLSAANVH
jgi:hypothetical protein